MMRLKVQPADWRIGPALCGGLSLIHYHSFKAAASLPALRQRYTEEMQQITWNGVSASWFPTEWKRRALTVGGIV